MLAFSKHSGVFIMDWAERGKWDITEATVPRPLYDILKYLEKQETLVWEGNSIIIPQISELMIRFHRPFKTCFFESIVYKREVLEFRVDGLASALEDFCSYKEKNTKHTEMLKQELIGMFDSPCFKIVEEGGVK